MLKHTFFSLVSYFGKSLLRVVISSYNEDSDYSLGQKSAKIKHQSLFRCIFVRFLKIFVLYPALYLFLGTFHHTEKVYRGKSSDSDDSVLGKDSISSISFFTIGAG